MTFKLNRRSFLLSLIALGAQYTLASDASAREVNKVWKEALAKPWYFEVNEYGTITEPDYTQNETWGEIFDIDVTQLKTPRDVICEVSACMPLMYHFHGLASDELDMLIHEQKKLDNMPQIRRQHVKKVIEALEADYEGWSDWIELEGQNGVERFKQSIVEWGKKSADYDQREWFPNNYGAQGKAKRFFVSLDIETRDALGVVIVEGDHPGSSYFAAELRNDIDSANETATDFALPFRFKQEGS